ncbi:MAG: acetate--CoA ligase [Candidatus Bathyarchaeia archaeon]|jgi:acetyl-CoA synthetase
MALREILPTKTMIFPEYRANLKILAEIHRESLEKPDAFWRKIGDELFWYEKKGPAFEEMAQPPYGRWFPEWKSNISYNALDRHVSGPKKNKIAYYWEGENGDKRTLTYNELYEEVNKFASALKKLGVKKGDRITIYLPMIPELPISMLAAVRIGAIHSVIFAGFTAQSIANRIDDSKSKLVITADGSFRKGKTLELKTIIDAAIKQTSGVEKVIVVRRAKNQVNMETGRDLWYHDLIASAEKYVEPEQVEGIHPSFILYTSGTTGKPKGTTHSNGGYMTWAHYTQKAVFDVNDNDIYWCTADIGWITGHTYIVYGPLIRGITSLMYEGTPDYPQPDRWWDLVEKYKVTIIYTSPTAIRMHMKFGEQWAQKHNLKSLRLLGTVGEPINPEAWKWYFKNIGRETTPIVDTWWQTETGGILISPQPGIVPIPLKQGSATLPIAGVDADVYSENGAPTKAGEKGYMVIKRPWPGQFMTLWNDADKFKQVYFTRFPGIYYAGDYAMKDDDGYFWLLGRADEVLKVAGHRIGTIELEDSLIAHPAVAESAVIGKSDPVKMEVPVAFVVLRPGFNPTPELKKELKNQVRNTIGPIAVPETIYFVSKLPKTRSAKIMRRVMKAVVENKAIGDVTTIEDETSVDEMKNAYSGLQAEMKS